MTSMTPEEKLEEQLEEEATAFENDLTTKATYKRSFERAIENKMKRENIGWAEAYLQVHGTEVRRRIRVKKTVEEYEKDYSEAWKK
jgi:hypothetical protein